jgi:hypothetical protein
LRISPLASLAPGCRWSAPAPCSRPHARAGEAYRESAVAMNKNLHPQFAAYPSLQVSIDTVDAWLMV